MISVPQGTGPMNVMMGPMGVFGAAARVLLGMAATFGLTRCGPPVADDEARSGTPVPPVERVDAGRPDTRVAQATTCLSPGDHYVSVTIPGSGTTPGGCSQFSFSTSSALVFDPRRPGGQTSYSFPLRFSPLTRLPLEGRNAALIPTINRDYQNLRIHLVPRDDCRFDATIEMLGGRSIPIYYYLATSSAPYCGLSSYATAPFVIQRGESVAGALCATLTRGGAAAVFGGLGCDQEMGQIYLSR